MFLKEYIREGVLWGVASQLQTVVREESESIIVFINRLKHLNSCCTLDERYSNNQFLDQFLQGLRHEHIYNGLVIKGINSWELDAIQLEDNLMISGEKVTIETKSISSQLFVHEPMTIKPIVKEKKVSNATLEQLIKAILAIQESMHHNQNPAPNSHMYLKREQQWCSICLGPHSTSECPKFRAKFNGYCNTCGKYRHQSKDCLVLKCVLANEQPLAWPGTPQVLAIRPPPATEQQPLHSTFRAQTFVQTLPLLPPVLGPQPPHPRITPIN